MRSNIRYIMTAVAMLPALIATAQDVANDKFAIKATVEKNIGKALCIDYSVGGMSSSSSSLDYGIDFGWTIWNDKHNYIEANVGLGYGNITLSSYLHGMDYHYSAPADADMDNDTYIRYYNLDGVYQKMRMERITLPLYLNYRYKFSKVFSLHALMGFRFGYNYKCKLSDVDAGVFSYGVYPQYDDLMIDASYMNEFGAAEIKELMHKPDVNKLSASFMAGIGAEFRIYGPLAVDLSVRYEGSMNDMFKASEAQILSFDAANAPVTYTVAQGQKVRPLPSYFNQSIISHLSYAASLICRF